MSGKRCSDCKHTKGIGEVFIGETNCPYFEYHDWSKGVPSRTDKRFTITQDFEEHHRQIRDNGKIIMGCFLEPQAEPIVKLLNELHEENQSLKEFVDQLQEELVLFKKAGADMSNDLNAQINNLTHQNQKQEREYRRLYDEMQDVYKSYREELRKNTQLTGTIHRICAEHHINSKYYLEEEE